MAEGRSQPGHLLCKGLAVIFDGFGSDVTAGRKNVAVLANVVDLGSLTETRNVLVFRRAFVPTPGVVGACDAGDVLVGQFAVYAICEGAQLAGIDE